MSRIIHRNYDDWKLASPDDERDDGDGYAERDPDADRDDHMDEQLRMETEMAAVNCTFTRQQLDQVFDILRDIEVMLDERADVDADVPADDMQMLMRLLVGVRDVIRKLEGR